MAGWIAGTDLALVHPAWGGVPMGVAFGALYRRATPESRRSVAAFMAILAAFYTWQASFLLLDPAASLGAAPIVDGVCRQSRPWSCAPAAAVSLLAGIGVRTDEAEMARLMRSRPRYGTYMLHAERGLALKLGGSGYTTAFGPIDYDGLVAARAKGLACMRLTLVLDHMVALLEARPDGVTLIDPQVGERRMSRAEFERDWKGQAILLLPERKKKGR